MIGFFNSFVLFWFDMPCKGLNDSGLTISLQNSYETLFFIVDLHAVSFSVTQFPTFSSF